MNRISSNTTLFWKIFVPTIYITIFGIFGLIIVFGKDIEWAFWSQWYVRASYWAMFVAVVLLMYMTIIKLKRVEMDQTHFIVTNYFKAYRYAIDDIESWDVYNFGIMELHSIKLKAKGKFGRKIRFIPFYIGIESLKEQIPQIKLLLEAKNQ